MDVGRKEEALAEADALWRAHPRMSAMWYARWLMMLFNGHLAEADAMCAPDAHLPEQLSPEAMQLMRGAVSMMRLEPEQRRPIVLRLLEPAPVALRLCTLAAFAGHTDLAYARLFRALDNGEDLIPEPAQTVSAGIARAYACADLFHFDAVTLRRDARFGRLCARLGLVDYWRESGTWPDCADEVPYDFRAACEKALAD